MYIEFNKKYEQISKHVGDNQINHRTQNQGKFKQKEQKQLSSVQSYKLPNKK